MSRSLLLLIVVALPIVNAIALPVRVLSRTRAELDVQKRWNALTITGVLRDDHGAALPLAEVTLVVVGIDARTRVTD
ncbi:MAG: hypothetical protein ACI9WU_001224, partial [Myxococcota bacterium]